MYLIRDFCLDHPLKWRVTVFYDNKEGKTNMNREILLIEPNYKNKYPPMGLMKISTYYKMQGDKVTFFKGDLIDLVLNETYERLLRRLYLKDKSVFWEKHQPDILKYLKKGNKKSLDKLLAASKRKRVIEVLLYYRDFFHKKKYFLPENLRYDRVGITTLFTFNWKITIETINFAKQLCKNIDDVMVGGVLASILPEEVEQATGIKPFVGTISQPGILDYNDIIVDTLPLDYSILEEIEYEYPAKNAYYAYTTRGCVNKCKFCAVPKLEPEYTEYLPVISQIDIATQRFGGKRDLLLMDNNVLASNRLEEIVGEIKEAGFDKNTKFVQPNIYEIAIENLKSNYNNKGYVRNIVKQFRDLAENYGKRIKQSYDINQTIKLLERNHLLEFHTANKQRILDTYDDVKDIFAEFYRSKSVKRHVDFNQGIDARLVTEENMKILSEIPIKPVRIAFDSWSLEKTYTKAIKIAVGCGHRHLSNYLLYNYLDKPEDLYYRLKLNVEMCDELGANIYSFPMKYHPIEDPEYFSNRDYIGKHWNRKFIRTIQAILNTTKGKIGTGKSFFDKAFGVDVDEYFKLLYMPETMIIYRMHFEKTGVVQEWWNKYSALSEEQLDIINPIIHTNVFTDIDKLNVENEILDVLKYYKIRRGDAQKQISELSDS